MSHKQLEDGRYLRTDIPNQTQVAPLDLIDPNEHNVRLFVEREKLEDLRSIYRRYKMGQNVVLPDPVIVRVKAGRLELLAGERRSYAAGLEGLTALPVRVVDLDDMAAYKFILDHNSNVQLTTLEMAFRAAEMQRLGFESDEISAALGDVGIHRYLTVGEMVDPNAVTSQEKLCDPSITVWHEAALEGQEHFNYCFRNWNAGIWDEKRCQKEFRKRGEKLPLDTNEKGLRLSVTKDGRRILARGTLNLDLHTREELLAMVDGYTRQLKALVMDGIADPSTGFGERHIYYFNPDKM